METKFIAISENEYNSFKHDEYERKIKELEDKIATLEKEKEDIAKAKAVRLEFSNAGIYGKHQTTIAVYSDTNFENEILESIKNTEFKHIVNTAPGVNLVFFEDADYIQVGDEFYYKNKWCDKLKNELFYLSSKIKALQKRKSDLESDIEILEHKIGKKDLNYDNMINRIIKNFGI